MINTEQYWAYQDCWKFPDGPVTAPAQRIWVSPRRVSARRHRRCCGPCGSSPFSRSPVTSDANSQRTSGQQYKIKDFVKDVQEYCPGTTIRAISRQKQQYGNSNILFLASDFGLVSVGGHQLLYQQSHIKANLAATCSPLLLPCVYWVAEPPNPM